MTAVDPTSMLRSGDNADEILPPSNLHGSQLTQTGSSSVNRHQQDRKDSSKLIAIMNSMKKSEKKKFQLLLQQFTNSNDRSVNLSELHDMMSRMSEVGEWSVPGTSGGGATPSSSSGPAGTPAATDPHSGAGASGSESGRGGGPSTQHQYQGARAVRVQVSAPPNYDHILPPNLPASTQSQQLLQHEHAEHLRHHSGPAGHPIHFQPTGGAGLLQVAAAAPSLGNIQMSIPMGETSLLVTRGGSGVPGASGPGQFQPGGHQVGGGAGDMSGSSPAPADHHLQITAASPAPAAASQQPLLTQNVVSPAPSQVDSFHQVRDTERYKRYKRTEQILREAGMYNITMQTQELEKKNALLQLEIEQFNRDVSAFVQDVLKNPQNKWLRDKILQKSQRRSK